jgi:putative ABC transport system permease protein
MLIGENFLLALNSIRANKSRSFLTMLGIIIGIASVIAIMTVGNSLNQSIASEMEGMGASDITLMIQQRSNEEVEDEYGMFYEEEPARSSLRSTDYITEEMIEEIKAKYPDQVAGVSLEQGLGGSKVQDGKLYANVNVLGLNEDGYEAKKLNITAGRDLLPIDFEEGKKSVIVSDKYVDKLFAGDSQAALGQVANVPIGDFIYQYTIVGVYEYKMEGMMVSMFADEDMATDMYLSLNAALNQLHQDHEYTYITVKTKTGAEIQPLMEDMENYLNSLYYRTNDSYKVKGMSMESMLSSMTSMLGNIQLAIAIIAGISLLVGGIGVMNIMMVSITERTKEIGTRKALGAKNSSIRFQFVMESVVLCVIGGVIGIILGIALGSLGASLLKFPASASISSIGLAFGVSAAIGIFFGFYPANRAAKMNPIDALRYE